MWNRKHKEKKNGNEELKKEFLADMSYGIRNPLNVIAGMTDIALRNTQNGCDADQIRPYLELIQNASCELQEVINKCFMQYELEETEEESEENELANSEDKHEILRNLRILIIEDSELNQMIFKELLEAHGAIISVADNGAEGYKLFIDSITGTFDVIFMDIKMPKMDGNQTTEKIRMSSHPQAKSIPIIALSADVFADDINNAIKSGMDAHVGKPISLDKIELTLKKVFKNKKIKKF